MLQAAAGAEGILSSWWNISGGGDCQTKALGVCLWLFI